MNTFEKLAIYGILLGVMAYGVACTAQQWEKAETTTTQVKTGIEVAKKTVDSPAAQTVATTTGTEPVRLASSGILEGLLIGALALERFFSWRRKLAYDRETAEKKE